MTRRKLRIIRIPRTPRVFKGGERRVYTRTVILSFFMFIIAVLCVIFNIAGETQVAGIQNLTLPVFFMILGFMLLIIDALR